MDWGETLLTYLGNARDTLLGKLRDRDTDIAKGLDPAVVTVTNPQTNMIRWNSATRKYEKYNGTSWVTLIDYFDIEIKALTGDVTKPAGSSVLTIAANAVTNAGLRDSGACSIIGRAANSSGDPADIAAGADDRLLARVSGSLQFVQLNAGMVPNDLLVYAKLQNVSATDRILGRASVGAGDIEEIVCTAAGRALLDDADAAAQRTTLGLGTLATQSGTFSDKVNRTGDTLTGQLALQGAVTGNSGMSTATGGLGEIDVRNNGTGAAMMAFHRVGAFACYFGLDTDNILKKGGWSLGAAAYPILSSDYMLLWKGFQSADQTLTAGGALTIAHGLPAKPKLCLMSLICQSGELGYSAGDEVFMGLNADTSYGISVVPDATNLNIRFSGHSSIFAVANKTTGTPTQLTNPANWKARFYAWG